MTTQTIEDDSDKLFLLSLHDELKSVPAHMKLKVKTQILEVLINVKDSNLFVPPFPNQFSHYAPRFAFPSLRHAFSSCPSAQMSQYGGYIPSSNSSVPSTFSHYSCSPSRFPSPSLRHTFSSCQSP